MRLEDVYMFGRPRGPIPVESRLTVKKKGEAPKCKTCKRFYECHKSNSPMRMACDIYERKKKRK